MTTTVNKQDRDTIRAEARRMGQRYRIVENGEVHFFGPIPNSTETGWWLFALTVADAIDWIKRG